MMSDILTKISVAICALQDAAVEIERLRGQPADRVIARGGGRDRCRKWLQQYLATEPKYSIDVINQGIAMGWSETIIRRAFQEVGGKGERVGVRWQWRIPHCDQDSDCTEEEAAKPTTRQAGTPEKIALMRARASAGLPVMANGDLPMGVDQNLD